MGVRRASAALIVVVAVLLATTTMVTGRAAAAVTTPFTARFDVNTNGSILLRGNSNLTCLIGVGGCAQARAGTATGAAANNNTYAMAYTDADGSLSTFNDSTATVDMPPGSTVLFAGLYWGADSTLAPSPGNRNKVRFRTPASSAWTPITASSLYTTGTGGTIYQGFADVTALVAGIGNGVYGVADIQTASGATNLFAGWSLAIAYRNPAEDMRSLRIYDGFGQVSSGDTDIPMAGFETPHTGTVHAKIGAVAYEGDYGTSGDSLEVDGHALADTQNQANNFFNSTASDSDSPVGGRNPPYVNLLGFDVDQVDATGMFANGATSTKLTLTTSGDQYYPGVITFTIDLYAPKITTTLTGTDLNGGDLLPGDVIEYRIAVRNDGSDTADGVTLADAIPPYTNYVPGSLTVLGAPMTDAGDGDGGWYAAGSAGWTLGSIPYLGTTWVTFRVSVAVGVPVGYAITNLVNVSYTGRTTSVSVAGTGGTVATTVLQPHADLAAGLAVTPAFVQRAATPVTVSYTMTVTNASGDLEPAATGTLTLPAGVSPGTMPVGCSATGPVITCALGPLVAGSSATATVPAVVDNTVAGSPVAGVTVAGSGSDGTPGNNTATAALAVNSPPDAVADTASTGHATPVTVTVLANDTDPDDAVGTLTVSLVGTPSHGVAVVHANQTVTYTPTTGWAGADTFQYRLDDPHGGSDTATVTVTTLNAPPVANNDSINTNYHVPVTIDVRQNDTDLNGDPLTITGVTQPPSPLIGTVTFTGSTVTLSPTALFLTGTITFTYTISDGRGGTATATVSVDVHNARPTAADDLLAVTYPAARTGVVVPVLANDTDPNGFGTLSVASVGQPPAGKGGTTLVGGVVTYTAPLGFSGNATFSYTITDGANTDTATATVTVGNAAPVAQPFIATTGYRTALTLDVLHWATDPNGDTLTVAGLTDPAHGVVTRDPLGTITYLPDVAWSGPDSFTYTISDGHGGTDTETVSVTVDNGVAVARDDWATAPGRTPVTVDVLANDDGDPNGDPLTLTVDSGPAHGTVSIGADRRVTYSPVAAFNGVDSFHYTLDDQHGGVVGATVTVTVVNTAPVARSDSMSTDTDTPVVVPVLANDDDPNGDPITVTAVAVGGHGTATDNGDGTITYAPDNGFYGTDSFVYSIRDPSGLTDSAIVTITVRNAAPVAADDVFPARPGVPITLPVLANDADPNTGQVITVTSITPAAKGTATLSGGVITYRADPGTAGTDGFDYVLTDDLGLTGAAHVTIAINGTPTAADDTVPVPADTIVDIPVLLNDTDPEGLPLTISAAGPATDGAVQVNPNGTVEYRPSAGYFGTDGFPYTVVDDVGNTDTAWVTVQVANAAPVARPDAGALLSDRTVLVDVLANDTDPNPGQTPSIDAAGLPGHGTATVEAGQIRYAPTSGYVGTDTFTYGISDGNGGTATGTVTISVSNGTPVAVPDYRTTPFQHPVPVDVLTNDLDPAGTLAVTGVGRPDHGTATVTAAGVDYTPPNGFAGFATLGYEATDDVGHRTSARIEVLVGVPPRVPNKQVTVATGQSVDLRLPATGLDGRPVTLVRIGQPAHGTATINADGSVTYIPEPGFSGSDAFTYEVVDADGNVATASVVVLVPWPPPIPLPPPTPPTTTPTTTPPTTAPTPPPTTPSSSPPTTSPSSASPTVSTPPAQPSSPPTRRNRPPVAADDRVTLATGDRVVIHPLLNDTDPDGDPLTIVGIRQPAHGTVTRGTDAALAAAGPPGALVYTPDRGFAGGSDAFGYTIGDGHGGRSTGSVTIRVVPVDDLPTTGHDVLAVARAGLLAVTAGGALYWFGVLLDSRGPKPGRHQR